MRTERAAHADLAIALAGREHEHPIDPDSGQDDRNRRESDEHVREQAHAVPLLVLEIRERLDPVRREVVIELLHDVTEQVPIRVRVARRPDRDGHESPRQLGEGAVDRRREGAVLPRLVVIDVRGHADDRDGTGIGRLGLVDHFAERVLAREVLVDERLVHDRDVRRVGPVARVELAAREERLAERFEKTRGDRHGMGHGIIRAILVFLAFDGEPQILRTGSGHRRRGSGGEHTGSCPQLRHQFLEEPALLVGGIGRRGQPDARAHEAPHVSAVVLLQPEHGSPGHEARARQQRHGESHFHDHHGGRELVEPHTRARATAITQHAHDIGAGRAQRREDAGEQCRQHGDGARKERDISIDGECPPQRRHRLLGFMDGDVRQVQGDGRQHEPPDDAEHADDQAFHQHLHEQAAALRAERDAHAGFVHPKIRSHEDQAGHVRAGDEQHQHHRREHRVDDLVVVGDRAFRHGHHVRGDARVAARIELGEPLEDIGRFGRGLRTRHPFCEASHSYDANSGFVRLVAPMLLHRVPHHRQPELFDGRERKALRHHADDPRRLRVHAYDATNYFRVLVEASAPEVVAEDRHGLRRRQIVFGSEVTAEHRPRAQHAQEIPRGPAAGVALRAAIARDQYGAGVVRRQILEGFLLLLQLLEVHILKRGVVIAACRLIREYRIEPLALRERRRLARRRVDDAVGKDGRAEAEREHARSQDQERG